MPTPHKPSLARDLSLDPETSAKLMCLAYETGLPLSYLVRLAVIQFLNSGARTLPRTRKLPESLDSKK